MPTEDCRCQSVRMRKIEFGRFGRRVIEADFSGGELSSDGGLLLLRQVDRAPGLEPRGGCGDPRSTRSRAHHARPARSAGAAPVRSVLRLRGPERPRGAARRCADANRGRARRAAGLAPTFSRLENRATRAQAWALHEVLIEQFIASHKQRARGTGARHRRLGRAAARQAGAAAVPRLLRPPLLLAAVRVLRPGDAGVRTCGPARSTAPSTPRP